MSCSTDVRRARAFLQHAAEPANPVIARYVADVGPVDAAHHVYEGSAPSGVLTESRHDVDWMRADAGLHTAAELGARFVIPEDDEWPAGVVGGLSTLAADDATLGGLPLGLWVQGEPRLDDLASARSVAIVGARAATEYGEHHAAEFAYTLVSRNVTVWSGAAYGIDGAAHRGALAADRRACTVAVLACGIDYGYPAGHVGLLKRITASGAVVSEYPPGVPPARHRFLLRHRLLSAFTRATVVVEAGQRSGARHAARLADKLGRPVLALPGPLSSAASAGCHRLIQDGTARLVTSADDVIAVIEESEGEVDPEPEAATPLDEADRR
ncbi:DNA-processing protein DprA [Amycolatopsis sp. DG1A-15b]|uniref:DNA-processing protein DprA n=1 Tax=Amycolatopsis sp. DG1A-15b TaxID=3052846 RepID=UPI00255BE9AF|nr:DNA-processing protein DprA [Amycolatopsis sp. DG1A-15b]WIX85759.1 DNA-processing protein DprA [Amycolatopsis sp. DG1A-15b]